MPPRCLKYALPLLVLPLWPFATGPVLALDESDPYFVDGQETLKKRKAIKANKRRAKNVILFVADGMDPTTVTAARIYDGQTRGEEGEENFLAFEKLPHIAMAKTYNVDAQTPDSAGTMSAMATGVKTKIGVISVTSKVVRSNCKSGLETIVPTFTELAEQAGLATGVVSTARLTHATPAATYAHSANREWERDTNMPESAVKAGCSDIARQLIEFPYGDGLEVAMGGGRTNFLPVDVADPEDEDQTGGRRDGRNLVEEWKAKSNNHVFAWDQKSFDSIDPSTSPKVLGLFERSHLEYELDRESDAGGEPSLADMTRLAIDVLSRDKKGFVLVVEGGRVDHAHHAGNAARALKDTQAFSEAVAVAKEMTNDRDTLIIVTADHGHTLTFAGYPRKGSNILGLATAIYSVTDLGDGFARAEDGKPYTTLGYANGPGSVFFRRPEDGTRPRPTADQVADVNYRQQAVVPSGSETHGGQDVTIYASGPNAYLFDGVVEQSYIFHVIDDALKLRQKTEQNSAP